MGKYMRKCKGSGHGELAMMEVSPQVVGVRTRAGATAMAAAMATATSSEAADEGGSAAKRRKAVAGKGEMEIAYLVLRSRSVVMKPRISRSTANSGRRRCRSAELGRISCCSSNASCEVSPEDGPSRSGSHAEGEEDLDTAGCNLASSRERSEATPSSNRREEAGDLESTAERESRRRSTAEMPSETEIEEFFAAAERDERQRFAKKYNYDVVNDLPLEGRYEWVRVNP